LSEKAVCFKSEMKIYTFQDAGHNLNGARDMSNSQTVNSIALSPWLDMVMALEWFTPLP